MIVLIFNLNVGVVVSRDSKSRFTTIIIIISSRRDQDRRDSLIKSLSFPFPFENITGEVKLTKSGTKKRNCSSVNLTSYTKLFFLVLDFEEVELLGVVDKGVWAGV